MEVTDKSTLNFEGYIRTGIGVSDGGEGQAEFMAPGAATKYRLGNEADTNIEMAFNYRHYLDAQKAAEDPSVQAYLMLDGYTKRDNGLDITLDHVAQAYVSFDNFIGEGVKAWAGRRYYDRQSIHMTDHFWLNTGQNSQAGAGIEGIKLGGADFSAAIIRAEDNQANDAIDSTGLDFRLKNIALNEGGNLNFWAYYNSRPENETAGLDDESGYGLAAWHTQSLLDGRGSNTIHAIYRDGTAVPQHGFTPNPLMNNGTTLDINTFELATDLVVSATENVDVGFTALYRTTEEETAAGTTTTDWYSIGVRPQIAMTEHLSWVFDLGYDRVDNGTTDAGLMKSTVAFQIGKGKGYWSRPVLRVFGTYAQWGDEFEGQVGGDVYADRTDGWTTGVQTEWWW
ncbi:maltoporin [Marinobacterium nitratireducens]|uniref:Maltoporin n=2 Tax=Marinobacterium nitratireducens TaxID=518897 RepID=A0A917ZMZ4_9GAMM|nr:maltoporin [Marinobacterium nitratireducens]